MQLRSVVHRPVCHHTKRHVTVARSKPPHYKQFRVGERYAANATHGAPPGILCASNFCLLIDIYKPYSEPKTLAHKTKIIFLNFVLVFLIFCTQR